MGQIVSSRNLSVKRPDRFRAISLFCALLLISLLATSLVSAGDPVTVSQRDRQFSPDQVQLARGSKLHVVNDDKVTHHIYVKSPEMNFDSGGQPIGKTIVLTFDKAGNFVVRCAIHPIMQLHVTID